MTTPRQRAPVGPHATWRAVHDAVESNIDPMGVTMPMMHAQLAWLMHPQELADAMSEFSMKMLALQAHSWQRALGMQSPDIEQPNPDDNRFSDPTWTEAASWDIAKEWYLLMTRQMQDMLYDTPGLSNKDRRRAAFWWRKWLNAMAPTNFFWTNPVAMRKAAETNGESLMRGMKIFLEDIKAGTVRMTGTDDFHVGKDLAVTPGKVVFRNQLLEVIHYTPTQAKVYETPLVIVTPWINKYYILDLNPKKSLVKYLLDQGFDVYITSWKNPTEDMRNVSFDDYLVDGIGKAIEVARSVSGAKQVHATGYCIGGAALATYMAWANRHYPADKVPVKSATFFTTLTDYHKPGDVEVFLDEGSFQWLARTMEQKGYLDGKEMASAFRLLRSNSLIWHYVVHGYLYGETPPPFDVLYWNMDTTRMPAAMHSWYLREFYLNNNLIKKDALTVAGEQIDLERIVQPIYEVAAEDDHIAPWRQTFRLNAFVSGQKRYVLSSSGHILGIINPVVNPPKREYRVGQAERHDTADTWRDRAEHRAGSWWEDWMTWLKPMSGKAGAPPKLDTKQYPALADAPGTYVLES
ncbi:MAG: alpha/beta fold hydrolase [Sterolibacteriaceae bacterium MAG5]|nr:alpha/beta fold hydrolase [Candidatus Nitricoxidireducens bremensis]